MKNNILHLFNKFLPPVLFLLLSLNQSNAQQAKTNNDLSNLIQLTNAEYNMGKIESGKSAEYNITVKNISKDTISIQRIQAGCGCTSPKYAPGQVLRPGDVTMITLGFDGKTIGPFTKFADIFFGNGKSVKIKFSGEAIKK